MSCEESTAVVEDISMQSAWPSEMTINSPNRTLHLVWDGLHAAIPHKVLRTSCRCSVCESTRRKINDVIPVEPDVSLLRIVPVGAIGVQLFFSDNHERGIYPWAYLRQIAFGPVEAGFTESLMKGWRDE